MSPSFELVAPFTTESLAAFRATIVADAKAGASRSIIDLDAAGVLDSPVIAMLIATLREVREVGGSIVLVTNGSRALETLRITGLDQVFTVVSPDDAAHGANGSRAGGPAPRRQPGARARLAVALLGALVALTAAGGATPGHVATAAVYASIVR